MNQFNVNQKKILKNITFIKNSRELQKLLAFGFFIHCTWGGLGTILPFWFEQTKALENFTYYYSTLTFIAGTSFLWTNIINKIEIKKLVLIPSFIYLIRGFLLLFPTNILITIISGACGGIGIILYALISRTWINNWDNEKEKSYVIGWTYSEFRIANAVSVALAGLGFSILGTKICGLQVLVLFSSILPLISYFFFKNSKLQIVRKTTIPVLNKISQCLQINKNIVKWNLICNFFTGIHTGLMLPYSIILLNKIGFSPAISAGLISIGNFLKIFCQPIFNGLYQPQKKGSQIFFIGILCALLIRSWNADLSTTFLTLIVLITLIVQTVFTFLENNIAYSVFPKDWSLQIFTLGSFVFHLGNIADSFVGSFLISRWNIAYLIFTGSFTIGFSGLLYYLFIKSLKPSSCLLETKTKAICKIQ